MWVVKALENINGRGNSEIKSVVKLNRRSYIGAWKIVSRICDFENNAVARVV